MARSTIPLLLLPALISLVNCFNEEAFVNAELDFRKCCGEGEVLSPADGDEPLKREVYVKYLKERMNVTCAKSELEMDLVVNSVEAGDGEDCMDVFVQRLSGGFVAAVKNGTLEEVAAYKKYPKCCPLGLSYSPRSHRCAEEADGKAVVVPKYNGMVLKHNLGHCKDDRLHAVVDYARFNMVNRTAYVNKTRFGEGAYCLDKLHGRQKYVLRTCQRVEEACRASQPPCFMKCCPEGHAYGQTSCVYSPKSGIDLQELLNNTDFKQTQFTLVQQLISSRKFPVDDFAIAINETFLKGQSVDICVEYTEDSSLVVFEYFDVDKNVLENSRSYVSAICIWISVLFLIPTIIFYLILPETQNLFGKCIVMYCLMLLFTFFAYLKMYIPGSSCSVVAFCILYLTLCPFTWMNVICFDMWMCLGRMKVKTKSSRLGDLKKFLWYFLYAMGLPAVWTTVTYAFYAGRWLPEAFNPHMGVGTCFFNRSPLTYDYYLFFIGPEFLLISVNCVLFVKTIMFCFEVKNEINRMRDSASHEKAKKRNIFRADKEKLAMLVKLAVIMGLSWTFEALSSIFHFRAMPVLNVVEIIGDLTNYCQGVLIFCVLILKRKILASIRQKFCGSLKNRRTSDSVTMTTSLYVNAHQGVGQEDGKRNSCK